MDDLLTTPWRSLYGVGLAPWTATLRGKRSELTLEGGELLMLCASIELDRVQRSNISRLLNERALSRRLLQWGDLMAGALGLRIEDAREGLTIGECLARVGVELASADVSGPVDMQAVRRGLRAATGGK